MVIEIHEGWIRQLTPKQHIVINQDIWTDNPYIKNLLMQNTLINQNYHIKISDNTIKMNLKRILERPITKDFAQKAEKLGYYIYCNKSEYSLESCVIKGRKVVKENKISIKLLNHIKELEQKKLDTDISVEINKNGYIFMFSKKISDDQEDPMYVGRRIEWWEDHFQKENYFLKK